MQCTCIVSSCPTNGLDVCFKFKCVLVCFSQITKHFKQSIENIEFLQNYYFCRDIEPVWLWYCEKFICILFSKMNGVLTSKSWMVNCKPSLLHSCLLFVPQLLKEHWTAYVYKRSKSSTCCEEQASLLVLFDDWQPVKHIVTVELQYVAQLQELAINTVLYNIQLCIFWLK